MTSNISSSANSRPGADIKQSLRIAVVGGGVAGVCAGIALDKAGFQQISIYESASKLSDVGAGINVGCNFYRILERWGLAARLEEIGAVSIVGTSIRKGDSDRELAFSSYDKVVDHFKAPIWVCTIHPRP